MTSFEIERRAFTPATVRDLKASGDRYTNWPVVYVLNDARSVYVGETLNAASRLKQHAAPDSRNRTMKQVRIVLDSTFNKSACLDLESQLIRYLSGDGSLQVVNRNDGVIDAEYYDKHVYEQTFVEIFDELRAQGLFEKSRHEIENSDLFKLSPFKALTDEQSGAVESILDALFEDLSGGTESTSIVQGAAGTGKTIVAIYMIKLLTDIGAAGDSDAFETDSAFSDFFLPDFRRHARGLRIGLVIPQQSLRKSVAEVFARTPGLSKAMVMSPFALGKSDEEFDVLFVDETHRLNRRANQASGMLNRDFRVINEKLFGSDADHWTQLDWVRAKSRHRILMIDSGQSVRPADLGQAEQRDLVEQAQREHRFHRLMTQMRVKSTSDYVGWIRAILSGERPAPIDLGDYDMRFFDDPVAMREAIRARESEAGLARMAAGYGYRWNSRTDPSAWDVVAGDLRMRWNSKTVDWISSPGSADEVGSIHTLQGYDLNYAGVIIGPELRWDAEAGRIRVDRDSYFDAKGKEDNPRLGIANSDDDLLALIVNIYVVLMTRGMLGTYVHVHDPALREALRGLFGA